MKKTSTLLLIGALWVSAGCEMPNEPIDILEPPTEPQNFEHIQSMHLRVDDKELCSKGVAVATVRGEYDVKVRYQEGWKRIWDGSCKVEAVWTETETYSYSTDPFDDTFEDPRIVENDDQGDCDFKEYPVPELYVNHKGWSCDSFAWEVQVNGEKIENTVSEDCTLSLSPLGFVSGSKIEITVSEKLGAIADSVSIECEI